MSIHKRKMGESGTRLQFLGRMLQYELLAGACLREPFCHTQMAGELMSLKKNILIEELPKDCTDISLGLATLAARVAYMNRATDIKILCLTELCSYTDFFVIATVANRRQLRAIASHMDVTMKGNGRQKLGMEGAGEDTGWMLLDYGDVIVQLFDEEAREYYQLDDLWDDAARIAFDVPSTTIEPDPEPDATEYFWE